MAWPRSTFLVRNAVVLLLCSSIWACDILSTECSSGEIPPDQAHRVSISQGAWGHVWFWRGNFKNNDPNYGCGGGTVRPVERLVLIYEEAIWPDDVVASEDPPGQGFFAGIRTPVVDSVPTDSLGFFEIPLPVGRYSLFVREDSLYYARGGAPNRAIGLIEVPEGGVDRVQIDLKYKAAF